MILDVPQDFSPFPAGRFVSDGPCSGEALGRRVHIGLALGDEVELRLDGAIGYGGSFISGFAEALHARGWLPSILAARLRLTSKDAELKEEFWAELLRAPNET